MTIQSPPDTNMAIYAILFKLETGLRELIIETMTSLAGGKWYKSRLPGDLLDKYRSGIAYERRMPWRSLVPHHPLYYIDFPDIRKIIERDDNWRDVFRNIFSRKDVAVSTLMDLEPVRNAIAHNRRAALSDVRSTEVAYSKFATMIGESRFEQLGTRCTHFLGIADALRELQRLCDDTAAACRDFQPLAAHDRIWLPIADAWWFDESYLGAPVDAICSYFDVLSEYKLLPRQRGTGHLIETWIKKSAFEERVKLAHENLATLLR